MIVLWSEFIGRRNPKPKLVFSDISEALRLSGTLQLSPESLLSCWSSLCGCCPNTPWSGKREFRDFLLQILAVCQDWSSIRKSGQCRIWVDYLSIVCVCVFSPPSTMSHSKMMLPLTGRPVAAITHFKSTIHAWTLAAKYHHEKCIHLFLFCYNELALSPEKKIGWSGEAFSFLGH